MIITPYTILTVVMYQSVPNGKITFMEGELL